MQTKIMKNIEGSATIDTAISNPINVKAQFKLEIRRFIFPSLSLSALEAHLVTLFAIPTGSVVDLLYKDEEDDLVSMTSDEELKYALGISKDLLRVVLKLRGENSWSANSAATQPTSPAIGFGYVGPFGGRRGGWHGHNGPYHGPHAYHGSRGQSYVPSAVPAGVEQAPVGAGEQVPATGANFFPAAGAPFAVEQGEQGPLSGHSEGGHPGHWKGRFGRRHESEDAEFKGRGHGRNHKNKDEKLAARHVKDVTIPDGTQLAPKTPFVKTWRVRNEGIDWPEGSKLIFISRRGDSLGGPEFVPVEGKVVAGSELDISVNLVAPDEPGQYNGFWRMCTPEGKKFGQRLWVSIQVLGSSSSSDENNNVPQAGQYDAQVKLIEEMGLDFKAPKIARLLRKYGGNVDAVVEKLNKKSTKCSKRGH